MVNLLANPNFEFGWSGVDTQAVHTKQQAGAALDSKPWWIWNSLPTPPETELVTHFKFEIVDASTPPDFPGEATRIVYVKTNGKRCGLVQSFPSNATIHTGVPSTLASAWVYVKSGKVGIGTGNRGNTELDAISSKTNTWELLKSINGVSPANQFIGYSATDNAEFYIADPKVEVLELRGRFQGTGQDNEIYVLYQLGKEVWWYLENHNLPIRNKYFKGTIQGNQISGSWSVVLNSATQTGQMVVEIIDNDHLKAIGDTGAFGDSQWTKILSS